MNQLTQTRRQELALFVKNFHERWGTYYATVIQAMTDYLDESTDIIPVLKDQWIVGEIGDLLNNDIDNWDGLDERVMNLLAHPTHWNTASYCSSRNGVFNWIQRLIARANSVDSFADITAKMSQYAIPETDILAEILDRNRFNLIKNDGTATIVGEYTLTKLDAHFQLIFSHSNESHLLHLLLKYRSDVADRELTEFLASSSNNPNPMRVDEADENCIDVLLASDPAKYGPTIEQLLPKLTTPDQYIRIFEKLHNKTTLSSTSSLLVGLRAYFERLWMANDRRSMYRLVFFTMYDDKTGKSAKVIEQKLRQYLALEDKNIAYQNCLKWFSEFPACPSELIPILTSYFQQETVPILGALLKTDPARLAYGDQRFFDVLFQELSRFNYTDYHAQVWAFTRYKNKKLRALAAVTLTKLGDEAIPEAQKLLTDKKADARQTGALILSLIKTDRALGLLRNALNSERNDDARDLMLESLVGLLPTPASPADVPALVQGAKQRGKLDAPIFPFLDETKLPPLFWTDVPQPLDADTVRYVLYRQSRSKDIRPDLEVRPLYSLIDRERSVAFAGYVLNAYLDAGADAKYRACLTLAAMLGGEAEADVLKAKAVQWADSSRGKMAEYAVQALALIGTNRALRAVEFFSRKYRSKNKNVGAAANEAFGIAAETLGISPYDLADSIIPDFGFEGLFRTVEAGGETYRVFVDTDFKLTYLNDDNRASKTPPKALPAALKDEFKEIGKEIRDIVKAQSGRLEQYLVIQRKWPANRWQAFFLGNPVMFAYAVRLVWGVFGADGKLQTTFQCLEDQTLVNEEGDEIDLTDEGFAGTLVGMVHPISLTPEQRTYWTDQLADAGIEPIFAQLDRRVVALPDADRNLTMDRQFEGVEYGGYGFVSKMEKLGWHRGSVQDAGGIASFYKDFPELGVMAIIMQNGILGVGYYDENAELGTLMFVKSGTVKFGSYSYDDPARDDDPRLLRLADVPAIVYSEVLADMLFFKENDAKKVRGL